MHLSRVSTVQCGSSCSIYDVGLSGTECHRAQLVGIKIEPCGDFIASQIVEEDCAILQVVLKAFMNSQQNQGYKRSGALTVNTSDPEAIRSSVW